ncbi:hypothetical protein EDD17DRAFT_1540756, partial [Pisolithus thermaeus]
MFGCASAAEGECGMHACTRCRTDWAISSSYSGYGRVGFDRRFRVYEISDYGETIRTYKRTEHDEIL